MSKVQRPDSEAYRSTFGERFAFARWWQTGNSIAETDAEFVRALGFASKGTPSNWRRMDTAPPEETCQLIAERTGVDATWLELGERGASPSPPRFARWLAAHRKARQRDEREGARVESGAQREEEKAPLKPLVFPRKRGGGNA